MKKQTKLWKMKDGNTIKICDMDDTHLKNTIKYLYDALDRKTEEAICIGISLSSTMQGEMAIDSIDNEVEDLYYNGLDPYEEYPILENLEKEARRRDL